MKNECGGREVHSTAAVPIVGSAWEILAMLNLPSFPELLSGYGR